LQSAKDLQVNYSIYDMTGKQILLNTASLKTGLTHLEIPFENIAAGIYLIKIENRQNGFSTSSKIMKF
jgi:hypothetical protein